jgi:glutathione S-transferase
VEPAILDLATAKLLEGDKPWSKEGVPLVEHRVRDRLRLLSARPGRADSLDGEFSAGDLLMVSVAFAARLAVNTRLSAAPAPARRLNKD